MAPAKLAALAAAKSIQDCYPAQWVNSAGAFLPPFCSLFHPELRQSARGSEILHVFHSENAANAVLAEYMEARREVARLREILSLLSARNCLPTYWDTVTFFPPTNAEAPWQEALAALEADADAPLP